MAVASMDTLEKLPLWSPNQIQLQNSLITKFRLVINKNFNLQLETYDQLYSWSVDNLEDFWEQFLIFSKVQLHNQYSSVLEKHKSMGDIPRWFLDSTLNFTQNVLRHRSDKIALIQLGENYFAQQNQDSTEDLLSAATSITYRRLYSDTVRLAMALKRLGIKRGDIVVGLVSNSVFAIKSALACAFIGAVWTCVSPDSQATAIIMRIQQTHPTILMVTPYVTYNNKLFKQFEKLEDILTAKLEVTSIKTVISDLPPKNAPLPEIPRNIQVSIFFVDEFVNKFSLEKEEDLLSNIDYFPFDHPLYVMYSSGTTGVPKGIVHSAGGTLIQHLKEHLLHNNLNEDSVLFFYTISSWMMWNWIVSALFTGCTLILYDGSPFYPTPYIFPEIVDKFKVTIWGCGAAYFQVIESKATNLRKQYSFESLECILSTGSVLPKHTFEFITTSIKNVQIGSISGGTDIISCFLGNNPLVDVYSGELQRRNLGMAVNVFCEDVSCQKNHFDTPGELVCIKPFPSMPVYFVGDTPQRSKYLETYFSKYPGVWCQGDFCEINSSTLGITIHGRSDATLNPNGVRFGSSEIYNILETLNLVHHMDEILDSLVVGQQLTSETEKCILFVKCSKSTIFDIKLVEKIRNTIRNHLSHRHLPFKILPVSDIPYTLGAKKVELLIKKLISNKISLDEALKSGSNTLRNPSCIEEYGNFLANGTL